MRWQSKERASTSSATWWCLSLAFEAVKSASFNWKAIANGCQNDGHLKLRQWQTIFDWHQQSPSPTVVLAGDEVQAPLFAQRLDDPALLKTLCELPEGCRRCNIPWACREASWQTLPIHELDAIGQVAKRR